MSVVHILTPWSSLTVSCRVPKLVLGNAMTCRPIRKAYGDTDKYLMTVNVKKPVTLVLHATFQLLHFYINNKIIKTIKYNMQYLETLFVG
jgi:hypothetical protein